MKDIKEFLASIGLGKNEVEVYTYLAETGTSSVLDISKKTSIHRSNIYDALRQLVNKGLVFEIKGDKKLFHARSPDSLQDYLKHKQLELSEIISEYKKRYHPQSEDSMVKLSKGIFALREAITSLLETNDNILTYGIPVKASEIIGPVMKDFHKERTKKEIIMKHIYNSDSISRVKHLNKMKFTEARVFPSKYDSHVTTTISGDRLLFYIWGANDHDVTILELKNNELAEPYKKYFEVLWKKAKAV